MNAAYDIRKCSSINLKINQDDLNDFAVDRHGDILTVVCAVYFTNFI